MQDIALLSSQYAGENDMFWCLEYPSGANVELDQFANGKQQFALWHNIIERVSMRPSKTMRQNTLVRTIEFYVFQKSKTKDDKGINYHPLIMGCENTAVDFANWLCMQDGVQMDSYIIETGIDTNDATLVMARLTLTITEIVQLC